MLEIDHSEVITAPQISPGALFFQFFKIRFANTNDMPQIFKLRYQIYCEELGYFPNLAKKRLETDEYDSDAIHCVIEHKLTGKIVGCMRVVKSNLSRLPLSTYLPHVKLKERDIEISRVAVDPQYRQEVKGYKVPGLLFNALLLAINHIIEQNSFDDVYIFIENSMRSALTRMGLKLEQTPHMASVACGNGKVSNKYLYRVDTYTRKQTRPLRMSQFVNQIGLYLYPDKFERRANPDSVCPAIVRQPSRQQSEQQCPRGERPL
ncbi:acyl-homoserine-lactone synthase (plasmid) [Catenovulum sp. SX2]|uniref:acyl-homoserine-lactone synthase n=1 Tax=Catenovulum sp. SX2 TaxID=3398614 RepID=UPI003F83FD57